MLVVEGPDMVGKSTFCSALQSAVAELLPGPPGVDVVALSRDDGAMPPSGYLRKVRARRVADRFHMSEVAYGETLRVEHTPAGTFGGARLSPDEYRVVDGAVRAAGGMVVVVCAEEGTYERILLERLGAGQMFSEADNRRVNGWFLRAARLWERSEGGEVPAPTSDHLMLVDEAIALEGRTHPAAGDAQRVARRYAELQEALARRGAR